MANKKNIRTIYAILSQLGIKEQKENLVYQYTDGETTSLGAMPDKQAEELIRDLSEQNKDRDAKRSKMIRSVYSIAYDLNLTHVVDGKIKVDADRLNALVKRLSPQKKGIQQHTYKEMTVLLTIVRKYYKQQLKK